MKKLVSIAIACAISQSHAIGLKEVIDGLKEPIWATAPDNSTQYFYILEKRGVIRVLDRNTGKLLKNPLLDITDQIKIKFNEQGLLGMAFCPDFPTSGRFYLNYTDTKGATKISRFTCDPNSPLVAEKSSEEILITISQDFVNHNGGWIGFGIDKMLYIGMGDGGAANDIKKRAQDLSSLLGKLLRIDVSPNKGYSIPKDNPFVSNKEAKPEIYAYGLRNPWRCAFDPVKKGMFLADVGQSAREEVNFIPLEKLKGANFGWRLREGTVQTPKKRAGGAKKAEHIDPIYEYSRGTGSKDGFSITGGFPYYGEISELQGQYIFADWINPRIWSIQVEEGKAKNFKDLTDAINLKQHKISKISSFAIDPQGELYVIDFKLGKIFQFTN